MATLKDAIIAETGTTEPQKNEQIEIIDGTSIENLADTDIISFLEGDTTSAAATITLADLNTLKELIEYRVVNTLPILPFDFHQSFKFGPGIY